MNAQILLLATLASLASAAPFDPVEHVDPLPGKCTIGFEKIDHYYFGGSGGNTASSEFYGYIVGTDGTQTNVAGRRDDVNKPYVHAEGSYGGIGGGNWRVDSAFLDKDAIRDCTVTFRDITFKASEHNDGTCDTCEYFADHDVGKRNVEMADLLLADSGGGAFTGKSGCRCRFDCQ